MSNREELIHKAREAKEKAYAPYSKFKVGAALKTKDGDIFTGCNVENVSYGFAMCAERVAVFKAISEGHTEFDSIAISSSSKKPTFPCGGCRQVLSEFGNVKIFLDGSDKDYDLGDLLPHSFEKTQLFG